MLLSGGQASEQPIKFLEDVENVMDAGGEGRSRQTKRVPVQRPRRDGKGRDQDCARQLGRRKGSGPLSKVELSLALTFAVSRKKP